MKAEDYLRNYEKVNNIIPDSSGPKEQDKYDQLKGDLIPLKDSDIVANTEKCSAILQISNGAVYDENGDVKINNAKLKALEDSIEAAKWKASINFYSYKHDLDRIKKAPKRDDLTVLDTSEDIKSWMKVKYQYMLPHPASAGHGLNLQAGGNIIIGLGLLGPWIIYSSQWKTFIDKAKKCNHPSLVAKGYLDEDVIKALEGKEVGQRPSKCSKGEG